VGVNPPLTQIEHWLYDPFIETAKTIYIHRVYKMFTNVNANGALKTYKTDA